MKTRPIKAMTFMSDDVREEKSGKLSFIGTYGADIVVESVPSLMPKLCFTTRLIRGEGEFEIGYSLTTPDGKVKEAKGSYVLKQGGVSNISAVMSPFELSASGVYTFTVTFDGEKVDEYAFEVKVGKVP